MLIGTYLWGQGGLLKVDGCFAYGWTEDNTVTIFLTPQRTTPTSCLIHGSFIPKKTQEGHVIKESPSCRFFNIGSQLFHHFFLKRQFGFLDLQTQFGLPGLPSGNWSYRRPGMSTFSPTQGYPAKAALGQPPIISAWRKRNPPPGPGGSCPSPRRWWSSGDQPAVGLEVTLRRFR